MVSGEVLFKICDKQWQDVIYHFAYSPPSRAPASPTNMRQNPGKRPVQS